jgi:DNA-binding Xre family transcriptional regulator
MSRSVSMQWNLRQVMATRSIFQTSELVPLLAERGVSLSREHVYRLVTKTPQRLNMDVLAALCDILDCEPNDLLQPVVEQVKVAKTGSEPAGPGIGDLRPIRAKIRRPHEGT